MIVLILVLGLIVTGAFYFGYITLGRYYQSVDEQYVADAQKMVQTGAGFLGNILNFYHRSVVSTAKNSQLYEMLSYKNEKEIMQWSASIRRLLPSVRGAGLADMNGNILGDPVVQQVGKGCQKDMKAYLQDELEHYPAVHLMPENASQRHFDLLHTVTDESGKRVGVFFVSFYLDEIQQVMQQLLQNKDALTLIHGNGQVILSEGNIESDNFTSFSHLVPGTGWILRLDRPRPAEVYFTYQVVIANLVALLLVALLVYLSVKKLISLMQKDIQRVHDSLVDVLKGRFQVKQEPTLLMETSLLLPEIEQVAHSLQVRQEKLRFESLTDDLTGLFNRRYFDLMLSHDFSQSLRQSPSFLAIIDLNDFKAVNDAFGHVVGDKLLTMVARLLADRVRATDTLVRLGGDEFAIILHNIAQDSVQVWYEQLVKYFDEKMKQSVYREELPAAITLSVGISVIDRSRYSSEREVFEAADQAMYQAKSRKGDKSVVVLFNIGQPPSLNH